MFVNGGSGQPGHRTNHELIGLAANRTWTALAPDKVTGSRKGGSDIPGLLTAAQAKFLLQAVVAEVLTWMRPEVPPYSLFDCHSGLNSTTRAESAG